MRNFNEWELRRLQLELQQLDEDFTELNNYFNSEAFNFSNEYFDESTTDMVCKNSNVADLNDQSIELFTSIEATDEKNDVQMLLEGKFIDY